MRDYSIHVSPIQFIAFKSIDIDREINCHSRATIVGYISDEMAEEYTAMLLRELWVAIEAVLDSGERELLMRGVVTEFSIDHGAHNKELTLTIHSGSYLMDVEEHFRTFQNGDISYADLLSILDEGYPDADHIGAKLAAEPIGDFLMQYKETDWKFIKRVASRLQYHISPADRHTGARYYFGLKEGTQIQFPDYAKYTANKFVSDYMIKKRSKEINLLENDCLEFTVTSRDIYRIWDKTIMLERFPVYIYKIESRYTQEELLHHYYMRTADGLSMLRAYNQPASGCSFEAKVKEIKQDLVRIDVLGDENTKQQVTKWFKYSTVYSTPDGTGWYCMPEKGDTVRLHIPSKREYDGYVISSVHLDVTGGDRQNPDHKSIMNKYRKEILFTPDKLRLTNNKGITVEIVDQEGVRIVSNKAIHIKAKDSVTISSERSYMTVAGTDSVTIKQSGASVHMDDDISFIGGEFRIQ